MVTKRVRRAFYNGDDQAKYRYPAFLATVYSVERGWLVPQHYIQRGVFFAVSVVFFAVK